MKPVARLAAIRCALLLLLLLLWVAVCGGCSLWHSHFAAGEVGTLPNPLEIPVSDREFVWNQIVDTVDDYFDIAREERVRLVGNVLTEGRIETQPRTGASVAEV